MYYFYIADIDLEGKEGSMSLREYISLKCSIIEERIDNIIRINDIFLQLYNI